MKAWAGLVAAEVFLLITVTPPFSLGTTPMAWMVRNLVLSPHCGDVVAVGIGYTLSLTKPACCKPQKSAVRHRPHLRLHDPHTLREFLFVRFRGSLEN